LWRLRSLFLAEGCDRDRFDAAVYDTMVGLPPLATMTMAANNLVSAIRWSYPRDAIAADRASCAMQQNCLLDCHRVLPLLGVGEGGSVLAPTMSRIHLWQGEEAGLSKAPSSVQLRLDLPPGTRSISLTWAERLTFKDFAPRNPPLYRLVYKKAAMIEFTYLDRAVEHDGTEVSMVYQAEEVGQIPILQPVEIELQEACGASYYVSFLNFGLPLILENVHAEAKVDQELAETCLRGPAYAPPDNAALDGYCEALLATAVDAPVCDFAWPHPIEPCPYSNAGNDDDGTGRSPEPEDPTSCLCTGSHQPMGFAAGLLFLLGCRRRWLSSRGR